MPSGPARVSDSATTRAHLDALDALPLRAASAWTLVHNQQEFTSFVEQTGGSAHAPQHADLPNDPAYVLNSLKLAPIDDLSLAAQLKWWRPSGAEHRAALQRLWLYTCALADRAAHEYPPDPGLARRLAFVPSIGAFALAAAAPEAFLEWVGLAEPKSRAAWERSHLGEEMPFLTRRFAERFGLCELAVAAAWVVDSDELIGTLPVEDQPLLRAVRAAGTWVESSPIALFPRPESIADHNSRAKRAWAADFQASPDREFLPGSPPLREETLLRCHAQLLLTLRHERAEILAARSLIQTVTSSRAPLSGHSWARDAQTALGAADPTATVEVRWLENNNPLANTPRPFQTTKEPDELHILGSATRPRAEIKIWRADSRSPLITPALRPAWNAWVNSVAEFDHLWKNLHEVASVVKGRSDPALSDDGLADATALAEFAAGAGHELNNPLAVIMGRAQLLLQRTQDPEAQRSLRVMISQCQRAHRMLRDLMFVARPVAPRPRACLAADVVRRSIDDLSDDAATRGVALRVETSENQPLIETDVEQLRHLVDILLRNALEASSQGHEIVVRCEYREERLNIEVWDQGRGFTREEGRLLFIPFYCGRHAGRGLGLGLPRIAHYVNAIGGTLKWASKPGIGTVFRVTIPAPPVVQISAA